MSACLFFSVAWDPLPSPFRQNSVPSGCRIDTLSSQRLPLSAGSSQHGCLSRLAGECLSNLRKEAEPLLRPHLIKPGPPRISSLSVHSKSTMLQILPPLLGNVNESWSDSPSQPHPPHLKGRGYTRCAVVGVWWESWRSS